MKDDMAGKTALVTGAGKKTGIGFGIAKSLAGRGAHIVIADLGALTPGDPEKGAGARREMEDICAFLRETYSVRALAVDVDVTDNGKIAAMIASIKKDFQHIDILCNNAGASFGVPAAFHTYDEELWLKTIDVNLHGAFRITRAVLPLMTGSPGSIVNTSSRAAKVAPLLNGAYAVAKAGINMLTRVMARELAGMNIRVNAVCPGQIDTDLEKWRFGLEAKLLNSTVEAREKEMIKTIPQGRLGTIEEVGSVVAFLASNDSSYMTGQTINVCGGQLMEL
ncbi:MAG: NAD(P)-dependent oxidoreductase [Spirochaetae bacterium HGW-Spirochaetae-1]|jgi:NAD(P)-dependent dehydrogenase (short-subunit alcohol dehydrogenase family)|nr:MAG: NAD(P)-dependent oxidoreductase [Spirochaetae bacterium HGW-Spirochaetae-1]